MAITITEADKQKFKAAISKIDIMRQIHTQGWIALTDPNNPIHLYAFIRCLEHIGELLNPRQMKPDSIFRNTPQVPWEKTTDIRNLLGHKYHQDFRNHTFSLFQTMEDYERLKQQLLNLLEAETLDDSLSYKLSETHYSNDSTPPNEAFANQFQQRISIPELPSDDLQTRLRCMLETLTILENIINLPAQASYEGEKKLLAIQRCLQVIGQIVREIPIAPYQQQIINHFITHGDDDNSAFVMWRRLYGIRIDIAHAEALTELDEQPLLEDARAVHLFIPTIQYIFDLNQRKLLLFNDTNRVINQIQASYTQMVSVSQENYNMYVT